MAFGAGGLAPPVMPAQRHDGQDHAILAARHELYIKARALNPARGCVVQANGTSVSDEALAA